MSDLVAALKRSVREEEGRQYTQVDRDFHEELRQLERSVDLLSSFAPREDVPRFARDINEIVRDSIDRHRDSALRAGVTLSETVAEGSCPVHVDPERIAWVLDNVLKNALEVSALGQRVEIRSLRGGTECRVEVKDEGPGIRPEHLSRIFTPFFTTKENGSGLTLAGCKKLMKDLGGDIRVDSTWGEGATFSITIPREQGRQVAA
jgi:signal transduction histidine kinase